MKWIREHFIKKTLGKSSLTTKAKTIPHYGEIRKICLIGENKEELETTTRILLQSLDHDLEIHRIYYDEKTVDQDSFSHRDFSLFGHPQQKLNEFLTLRPDLIIFTPEKANFFSIYLLHLMREPYAAGFYTEALKPYLDLMLNREGKDLDTALEQLINYIKQIN